jgi:predicted regulator of Ras-like GTPase activity (Roadblock/LC7/MglB family)
MSGDAAQVLAGLRDVRGTVGSFFVSDDGQLVARDLPAIFEDEVLAQSAQRIVQLIEAFAAGGEDVLFCRVRFGEHVLCMRPTHQGILCAFATAEAQVLAVRMGLGLAAQRLTKLDARRPTLQQEAP